MSLRTENEFICAILEEKLQIPDILKANFEPTWLKYNAEIWEWLLTYWQTNNKLPTKDLTFTRYPEFQEVPLENQPSEILDALRRNSEGDRFVDAINQTVTLYQKTGNVASAKTFLQERLEKFDNNTQQDVFDLTSDDDIRQLEKQYLERQKLLSERGFVGIPTGFGKELDGWLNGGSQKGNLYGILAPLGVGKCLGKDTPVLMYDGGTKLVQEIRPGDYLMGDDSKPRVVLNINRGYGKLYKIEQKWGDTYIVNDEHILTLENMYTNNRFDISIKEYLSKSKWFRDTNKGVKCGIDFPETNVDIEPYLLGLWLGDGTSKYPEITTPDEEIVQYLTDWCVKNGLYLHKSPSDIRYWLSSGNTGHKKENPFWNFLKENNLINNKHIPIKYKINSRKNRLELLAGLIDTDGYLTGNGYEIIVKGKQLCDDIVFLVRSLGFTCSINKKTVKINGKTPFYYKLYIGGNIREIPVILERKKPKIFQQKKNHLLSSIKISDFGYGEYFGFTLTGNGRFLLGDFTITHNTWSSVVLAAAALEHGFTPFILALEGTLEKEGYRVLSATTGISNSGLHTATIKHDELDNAFNVLKRKAQKHGSNFYLALHGNREFYSPAILRQKLIQYKPKICIVDYLTLMGNSDTSPDDWATYSAISKSLKRIAVSLEIPVWATIQGTRLSTTKEFLDTNDSSYFGIQRDFDGIIGITRPKDRKHIIRVNGVKGRDAKDPDFKAAYRTNWDTGKVEFIEYITEDDSF